MFQVCTPLHFNNKAVNYKINTKTGLGALTVNQRPGFTSQLKPRQLLDTCVIIVLLHWPGYFEQQLSTGLDSADLLRQCPCPSITFEGKPFCDCESRCFSSTGASDEMISSSALRQCPANRRRLRLSVSEIGGRSP